MPIIHIKSSLHMLDLDLNTILPKPIIQKRFLSKRTAIKSKIILMIESSFINL
jgi:hypothetical protein